MDRASVSWYFQLPGNYSRLFGAKNGIQTNQRGFFFKENWHAGYIFECLILEKVLQMCFESVCGSFAVGFFGGPVLDRRRVADFVTLFFDPMHAQKNERNRYCMWRHLTLFSVFPGDVFFNPLGNDHISHRSTKNTGTFVSMIFRTSHLVGYVSSVPWRAWRV